MARILALFMILALVATQGGAIAAASCRHQNAREHALARESRDPKIAAVSLNEDAAAAVAAKKGSQSADPFSHWHGEMLPAEAATPILRPARRHRPRPGEQAALSSAAIPPLLEPPAA
jgi:hypothetical protein